MPTRLTLPLESLWQDVRYGLRQLRKSPSFAAAAILTLTLGIGSTVAMYAVGDALLFRPPPYRDAEALVTFAQRTGRGYRSWVDHSDPLA